MMISLNRIIDEIHDMVELAEIKGCTDFKELGNLKSVKEPLFCPKSNVQLVSAQKQKEQRRARKKEVDAVGEKVSYLLLFLFLSDL